MSNNVYFMAKLIEHQALTSGSASGASDDGVSSSADFSALLSGLQSEWLTQLLNTGGQAASVSYGAQQYAPLIESAADKYGVDADLVRAVMQTESDFRPNVVSAAGAQGLMQLMPGTARSLGVTDAFDPAQNIDGGVNYLSQQIGRFGDVRLALAAYNCGPSYVSRLGITDSSDAAQYARLGSGVRGYVDKVMSLYDAYGALSALSQTAGGADSA